MDLSIIIPAYNEEKRLGPTLEKIRAFMEGKDTSYEVIVVADGSEDRTREVAEESLLAKEGHITTLKNRKTRGKGYAIERGVRVADGDLILFTDADLSTPIEEIDKLIRSIKNGADIAIGSRSINTSEVLTRQPFYRQTMGKAFNLLIRLILGQKFKDTQCGFKLFKKDTAKVLFKQIKIPGFAFDAEIIYLALRNGFKVDEVGVKWLNSAESKVHPVFSSLQMLRDVIRVRFIHR